MCDCNLAWLISLVRSQEGYFIGMDSSQCAYPSQINMAEVNLSCGMIDAQQAKMPICHVQMRSVNTAHLHMTYGPFLFVDILYSVHSFCKLTKKECVNAQASMTCWPKVVQMAFSARCLPSLNMC